jgi:hypothetical protein
MEVDNEVPLDHVGAEGREGVHVAPKDRVVTWQDAFRAGVRGDQNSEDLEVLRIDDEVEEVHVGP